MSLAVFNAAHINAEWWEVNHEKAEPIPAGSGEHGLGLGRSIILANWAVDAELSLTCGCESSVISFLFLIACTTAVIDNGGSIGCGGMVVACVLAHWLLRHWWLHHHWLLCHHWLWLAVHWLLHHWLLAVHWLLLAVHWLLLVHLVLFK